MITEWAPHMGGRVVADDNRETPDAPRLMHARRRIAVLLVSLLTAALGVLATPAASQAAPVALTAARTADVAPAKVVPPAAPEIATPSSRVAAAAPVAVIVYYILRYGVPWLIRNAPTMYHTMVANYLVRVQVCRSLRANGSGWGWSPICWGT